MGTADCALYVTRRGGKRKEESGNRKEVHCVSRQGRCASTNNVGGCKPKMAGATDQPGTIHSRLDWSRDGAREQDACDRTVVPSPFNRFHGL